MDFKPISKPTDVQLFAISSEDTIISRKAIKIEDAVLVINFDKFIHWIVDNVQQNNGSLSDNWWKTGEKPPWEE